MKIPKWKTSASLIIAAKSINSTSFSRSNDQNYAILGLKRNHESGHLPNTYVFPGGVVDKSDFSLKWLDVFRRRGPSSTSDLNYLRLVTDEPRPMILSPSSYNWRSQSDSLPPELGLRLTAIRETFEECGILLARSNRESSLSRIGSNVAQVKDTKVWQARVESDPSNLADLFIELDSSPDVWSLYEWSNWLTPSFAPRRYNTMFFLTMVDDEPTVHCNLSEISDHKWCTPTQFLNLFSQQKLDLAPPQIYEFLRLKEFTELRSLKEVLNNSERRTKMTTTTFPHRLDAKDGQLYIYKGDDLYSKCPDFYTQVPVLTSDSSIEELERSSKFLNRISIDNDKIVRMVRNLNDGNKNILWTSKTLISF